MVILEYIDLLINERLDGIAWCSNLAMSNSDGGWDKFEEHLSNASDQLSEARGNYNALTELNADISSVYPAALTEISEKLKEFDTIYTINKKEIEAAEATYQQAAMLARLTSAYRRYHEKLLERRITLLREWFDALLTIQGETEGNSEYHGQRLDKRLHAATKLVNAGKHTQITSSDRIDLDDLETDIRSMNDSIRTEVSATAYVTVAVALRDTFHEYYTNDLSELVRDVDPKALSVKERVQTAPETDEIVSGLEGEEAIEDHQAETVSEVLSTFYGVALTTGKRRAGYALANDLVDAIGPTADDDLVDELNELARQLKIKEVGDRVATFVDTEATTSDRERIQQLLTEHDGSVSRTIEATELERDAFFALLRELFEDGEIADLEARFE